MTNELEAEYRCGVEDPRVKRSAAKVDRQEIADAVVETAERFEGGSLASAVPADPDNDTAHAFRATTSRRHS